MFVFQFWALIIFTMSCLHSMETPDNYYQVLGVPANATDQAIKGAYQAQAKTSIATNDIEKLQKSWQAYEILKDATKRKDYDQLQRNPEMHKKFEELEEFFFDTVIATQRDKNEAKKKISDLDSLPTEQLATNSFINNLKHAIQALNLFLHDQQLSNELQQVIQQNKNDFILSINEIMEEYSKNPAVQYSLFEKSIGTLPLFYFEYSDQTVRSLIADKFLEIIQHIKDRMHRSGTKEISDLFIASTESAVDWLKPEYLNAFPMQAKYIDAFKNLLLEAYLIRLRMQLNTLLRALHL